jgi:hypothetical protein
MPNREADDELLGAALGPTNDCPPLEDLEHLLKDGAPEALKRHVDGCSYCETEVQMLRSFTSNELAGHEKTGVDAIAHRLKARTSTIATTRTAPVESRQSWWKQIFEVRWPSPAAATLAVVLLAVGLTIELRRGRKPSLDTGTGGTEVLRSSAIAILSPTGDLREKPSEIRWEATPNATRYRVRIMEVDRAEWWSADATSPRIDLPPSVETLIVPSKTLLVQVGAFDASGQKIAESEMVRFRLLQKVYTH